MESVNRLYGALQRSSTSRTSSNSNVASSTSSATHDSISSSMSSVERSSTTKVRPSIPDSLLNHPSMRLLRTAQWDDTVFSMAIPRSAFGAAMVPVKCTSSMGNGMECDEAILVAGGKGRRKSGVHSGVLNTVELFDPNNCTQAQICSHRLNIARYSCAAFAVTTNVMCVVGEKGQRNEYLDSVELVSTASAKLLPVGVFSLPRRMASFGVAVVSEKVIFIRRKNQRRYSKLCV